MRLNSLDRRRVLLLLTPLLASLSCEGGGVIKLPQLKDSGTRDAALAFSCLSESSTACVGHVYYSCQRIGEFFQINQSDCAAKGLVCVIDRGCLTCKPRSTGCKDNSAMRCRSDGKAWEQIEQCDLEAGYQCDSGACADMCAVARRERSYVGCEFYAADLDNAALDELDDASRQQYAVVVSNLQKVPVEVYVEVNQASFGEPVKTKEVARIKVPPGDLEVFKLPRREVDGSTDNGINDGTHTAVTSNAYRVRSSHPIIAYQFNPLENVNVFSNEASLLIPSSAIGSNYTVVGWPQTIGHSDNPEYDFDSTSDKEDLRAFLTIIGAVENTNLKVTMGRKVVKVVGGGPVPEMGPGDVLQIDIGPFDVVNLETQGFMADFTGSFIEASQPVSVFVGSEASDAPVFGTYETRQCCADHLEEQLFPNNTLGTNYIIARMPNRAKALNAALIDPHDWVAVSDEPEWVRIVAAAKGVTKVETTLPPPDDQFNLKQYQDKMLRADQDFMLAADKVIAVLQALPSQEVVGIPKYFPGGDPSIIAVSPTEQYRKSYVFLTPDKYAFDFVTITAPAGARVVLDGAPVSEQCITSAIQGFEADAGNSQSGWVAHRCQFSFPAITSPPIPRISAGERHDGVHTLEADQPVGIVVFGFDRFVSYAYVGGLNLDILY